MISVMRSGTIAFLLGATSVTLVAPTAFAGNTAAAPALSTVTFSVPGMTCPLCPATVKAAMSGVKGVQSVKVDLASRTATVVFDTSMTSATAIAAASENAGYKALARS